MDYPNKTLGERIIDLARLATAMHLEEALTFASPVKSGPVTDSDQRREAGGAGPSSRGSRADRSMDGANRFTDEATRRTDAADNRPHGAAD